MAPHLVRAQSTYKAIRIHSFHHTHTPTHMRTHTPTCHTHTHTKYMHYWWQIGNLFLCFERVKLKSNEALSQHSPSLYLHPKACMHINSECFITEWTAAELLQGRARRSAPPQGAFFSDTWSKRECPVTTAVVAIMIWSSVRQTRKKDKRLLSN